MRISAIQNYQRNTAYFSGEKKNKLKNAAGAAVIALATAVPATNADAQYYYYTPPITFQPPATLHTPASVPDCFIIGDLKTFNGGKSMEQVFNEIDLNENGTISANEVVRTDRNNKTRYNVYPYNIYTQYQSQYTRNQFQDLSETYNEDDSNPNTINYNEYKAIMKDFLDYRNVTNFMDLFNSPGLYPLPPLYNPFRPEPPHHHRHRDHDRPPGHHRR